MRIEKRKRKNQELSGERREKKKKKKQYTLNKINKSTLPFLLLFTLHVYICISTAIPSMHFQSYRYKMDSIDHK